jgi:hypothetical protein
MSKHIGRVNSSERNPGSPGVVVDISAAGVEVTSENPRSASIQADSVGTRCDTVTLQPTDARTLAAMLVHAAEEVERRRYPPKDIRERIARQRGPETGDYGRGWNAAINAALHQIDRDE